jgi:hypothetical protein
VTTRRLDRLGMGRAAGSSTGVDGGGAGTGGVAGRGSAAGGRWLGAVLGFSRSARGFAGSRRNAGTVGTSGSPCALREAVRPPAGCSERGESGAGIAGRA